MSEEQKEAGVSGAGRFELSEEAIQYALSTLWKVTGAASQGGKKDAYRARLVEVERTLGVMIGRIRTAGFVGEPAPPLTSEVTRRLEADLLTAKHLASSSARLRRPGGFGRAGNDAWR